MDIENLDFNQELILQEKLLEIYSLDSEKQNPEIKDSSLEEKDFGFYLQEALEDSYYLDFEKDSLEYFSNFQFKEQNLENLGPNNTSTSNINEQVWLEMIKKESTLNKIHDHDLSQFLQEYFSKAQNHTLEKSLLISLDKQKQQFNVNFNLADLKSLTVNYYPENKNLSARLFASKKINQILQKKLGKFKEKLSRKHKLEFLDFELDDLEYF